MTIAARTPSSCEASATACAWLPEENATTPAARCAASRVEISEYAPRNLKAPPRWKHSALRCTSAPTSPSRVRERSTGVRCATPSSRAAASRTSSRLSIAGMLPADAGDAG